MDHFDKLLSDAEKIPISGWDFHLLKGRWHETLPSWDYKHIVTNRFFPKCYLLDKGTGGGEFLSSLSNLPKNVTATEGYQPNYLIAQSHLSPLGINVIFTQSANSLPFPNDNFNLIINRHDSFYSIEIERILKQKGFFITEQIGGTNNLMINDFLGANNEFPNWTLDIATNDLINNGFEIIIQKEEFPITYFHDIGALIYYLRIVSWQIPDFTVDKYYDKLRTIHKSIITNGSIEIRNHLFLIEARKI